MPPKGQLDIQQPLVQSTPKIKETKRQQVGGASSRQHTAVSSILQHDGIDDLRYLFDLAYLKTVSVHSHTSEALIAKPTQG